MFDYKHKWNDHHDSIKKVNNNLGGGSIDLNDIRVDASNDASSQEMRTIVSFMTQATLQSG